MAKVLVDDALWVLIEPHLLRRKAHRPCAPSPPVSVVVPFCTALVAIVRRARDRRWSWRPVHGAGVHPGPRSPRLVRTARASRGGHQRRPLV